jgi:hypothetical protein
VVGDLDKDKITIGLGLVYSGLALIAIYPWIDEIISEIMYPYRDNYLHLIPYVLVIVLLITSSGLTLVYVFSPERLIFRRAAFYLGFGAWVAGLATFILAVVVEDSWIWRIGWGLFLYIALVIFGSILLVETRRYKTRERQIKSAKRRMAKGDYLEAGRAYRRAAKRSEKKRDSEEAVTYYREAADCYVSSQRWGAYNNFLKYRVVKSKIDPKEKIAILTEAAKKLMQVGELEKASTLQKIISSYEEKPFHAETRLAGDPILVLLGILYFVPVVPAWVFGVKIVNFLGRGTFPEICYPLLFGLFVITGSLLLNLNSLRSTEADAVLSLLGRPGLPGFIVGLSGSALTAIVSLFMIMKVDEWPYGGPYLNSQGIILIVISIICIVFGYLLYVRFSKYSEDLKSEIDVLTQKVNDGVVDEID